MTRHDITSSWAVDREFFDIYIFSLWLLWSTFGLPWADFDALLTPLGAPRLSLDVLWAPLGVLWTPLVPFGAPLASLLPPSGLPLAILGQMEPA